MARSEQKKDDGSEYAKGYAFAMAGRAWNHAGRVSLEWSEGFRQAMKDKREEELNAQRR